MVWSHWAVKNTHYKNAKGDIHTLSPWPLHVYQSWTRSPTAEVRSAVTSR